MSYLNCVYGILVIGETVSMPMVPVFEIIFVT